MQPSVSLAPWNSKKTKYATATTAKEKAIFPCSLYKKNPYPQKWEKKELNVMRGPKLAQEENTLAHIVMIVDEKCKYNSRTQINMHRSFSGIFFSSPFEKQTRSQDFFFFLIPIIPYYDTSAHRK